MAPQSDVHMAGKTRMAARLVIWKQRLKTSSDGVGPGRSVCARS